MQSLEDIILTKDCRGISALRPYLPRNFCKQAAQLTLEHMGVIFITTGFYTVEIEKPETDGPPGALAIGNALSQLGCSVYYVTDEITAPLMNALVGSRSKVISFPFADHTTSERYALTLLNEFRPSLLLAIERCGFTQDKKYLNLNGVDISEYNAKIDYLFHHHQGTIGIGDGGNEIGMGHLAEVIRTSPKLPQYPCVTRVKQLIIASVANWGGYGLVAALSRLTQRNLLPSVKETQTLLQDAVRLGAVDGIRRKSIVGVDGFSLEENLQILAQLHDLLAEEHIH